MKAFVVEERPLPSSDFFVIPALTAKGYRIVRCGLNELPDQDELEGALVVIVRYFSAAWKKLIEKTRQKLGRFIYFMDDDLFDVKAARGTLAGYRVRLAWKATRHMSWLQGQSPELWVSTPYLLEKYASWQPKLVLPSSIRSEINPASNPHRIFYHGTFTHEAEYKWLRPVIAEVLAADKRLHFELFGIKRISRLFQDLERVSIQKPLNWPEYQDFVTDGNGYIGLAPQLEMPFNRARSYTKIFDISRYGAVGIYSAGSANASVITNNVDGVIAGLERREWVEKILHLARNEDDWHRMRTNTAAMLDRLDDEAAKSYEKL